MVKTYFIQFDSFESMNDFRIMCIRDKKEFNYSNFKEYFKTYEQGLYSYIVNNYDKELLKEIWNDVKMDYYTITHKKIND